MCSMAIYEVMSSFLSGLSGDQTFAGGGYTENGRPSTVLNTSSIAGVKGVDGSSVAYAASKGRVNTIDLVTGRAWVPAASV